MRRRTAIANLAAAACVVLLAQWGAPTAAALGSPVLGSRDVDPLDWGSGSNWLRGVVALEPDDVWIVGNHETSKSEYQPVMRRYDGIVFSRVGFLRGSRGRHCNPTSVDATSADDVWLVCASGTERPYVEHWDGSTWRTQILPRAFATAYSHQLWSVWAGAPDDVWAVGEFKAFTDSRGMIEHFDGHRWRMETDSDISHVQVHGVSGTSATDVWAVGWVDYAAIGARILHFDGREWAVIDSPVSGLDVQLLDVTAVSANDVWVVGYSSDYETPFSAIILHWDGTSWALLDAGEGVHDDRLYGVSAVSSDDVWMVGSGSRNGGEDPHPVAIHWDGHALTSVPPRSPGTGEIHLVDVSALKPDDVWAVGYRAGPRDWIRMYQHWDGHTWSRHVGR